MLRKSVETRDWLHSLEPRTVRAVMKRVMEDMATIDSQASKNPSYAQLTAFQNTNGSLHLFCLPILNFSIRVHVMLTHKVKDCTLTSLLECSGSILVY